MLRMLRPNHRHPDSCDFQYARTHRNVISVGPLDAKLVYSITLPVIETDCCDRCVYHRCYALSVLMEFVGRKQEEHQPVIRRDPYGTQKTLGHRLCDRVCYDHSR